MANLLEVQNLQTSFLIEKKWYPAVDDVSFSLKKGETLGLVGESGCGKSVTSLSIMRLIKPPKAKITQGRVIFSGNDLLQLSEREMRDVRGDRISMVFQEPMTSLNPVFTIGDQIAEVYRAHRQMSKKDARHKAIEMLERVKIPAPQKRVDEFPHQLSGGMRQRVMIAMALACEPELLIADEPTTALDVTIQAQVLNLMARLQEEFQTAILLITHDLGVVAQVCKNVAVMYGGKIVEKAPTDEVFKNPLHPYTLGLMHSIPKLGVKQHHLSTIPGYVPSLTAMPKGCRFQDRCPWVMDKCRNEEPVLKAYGSDHLVACWNAGKSKTFD